MLLRSFDKPEHLSSVVAVHTDCCIIYSRYEIFKYSFESPNSKYPVKSHWLVLHRMARGRQYREAPVNHYLTTLNHRQKRNPEFSVKPIIARAICNRLLGLTISASNGSVVFLYTWHMTGRRCGFAGGVRQRSAPSGERQRSGGGQLGAEPVRR